MITRWSQLCSKHQVFLDFMLPFPFNLPIIPDFVYFVQFNPDVFIPITFIIFFLTLSLIPQFSRHSIHPVTFITPSFDFSIFLKLPKFL